jgi:hypothetical protein
VDELVGLGPWTWQVIVTERRVNYQNTELAVLLHGALWMCWAGAYLGRSCTVEWRSMGAGWERWGVWVTSMA